MRYAIPMLAPILLAACSSQTAPAPEATATASEGAVASTAAPAPSAADDIEHFLLQEYPDAGPIRYVLAWSDLDGDGSDEAIVYLAGSYFCGTGGCNTLILTPAGPMWRKVGDMSVSRTPISVLKTSTNGWRDLTVDISGGGMPGGIALLKFDGESYPSNPTVPPAESAEGRGEILIAKEPAFRDLQPVAKAD